jgi:hypothetical protein
MSMNMPLPVPPASPAITYARGRLVRITSLVVRLASTSAFSVRKTSISWRTRCAISR